MTQEQARKPWELRPLSSYNPTKRGRPYKPNQRGAGEMVRCAQKKGILANPKDCHCVDCGEKASEYDHRDYAKPLEVEPVCSRCNRARGSAKNNDRPYWNQIDAQGYGHLKKSGIGEKVENAPEQSSSVAEVANSRTPGVDPDVVKLSDEQNKIMSERRTRHVHQRGLEAKGKSFLRALHDWYGIDPLRCD